MLNIYNFASHILNFSTLIIFFVCLLIVILHLCGSIYFHPTCKLNANTYVIIIISAPSKKRKKRKDNYNFSCKDVDQ